MQLIQAAFLLRISKLKYEKVIKMLKRALKFAIGPSLGITLGSVIIPRIIFPHLYNKTYPPILLQAGLNFVVIYIASSLVSLLIEWIKSRAQSK